MCTRRGYEAGLVPGHQQHGRDGQGSDLVLRQPLGYRIRAARYQGPALWHGDGQHAGEFARTPRPVVAAQRLPAEAADARPIDFAAQCEAILTAGPPIVSSIMGIYPPDFVAQMKQRGIAWFATVTTVAEARAAEAAGADVVV